VIGTVSIVMGNAVLLEQRTLYIYIMLMVDERNTSIWKIFKVLQDFITETLYCISDFLELPTLLFMQTDRLSVNL